MARNTRVAGTGRPGAKPVGEKRYQGSKGSRKARPGGMPFKPQRCTAQKADGTGRCGARPVRDTVLCIGHTRSEAS